MHYFRFALSPRAAGAWLLLVLAPVLSAVQAQGLGPEIETWHTANGARVLYVHAPEVPMLDVRVVFDAGAARDGDHPGLARLTNGMLNQGAGRWDADAIAERFDGVGAVYGASADRDTAVVSLRSLTDRELLEPALDTFAAILAEPRFEPDALERERQRTLVALRNEAQSPGDLAEKAFYRAVYDQHPYASPVFGTEESVAKLTRAALRAFHERYYVGRNAVVAVVGALPRAQAQAVVERVIGGLPAGEAPPALPKVEPVETDLHFIAHPSEQTHLLVGEKGIARNDPDYFPLYVGNHILGGSGFTSRVFKEIREERGLAYSAYSYFVPMQRPGPFLMGLQTRAAEAAQALEVLRQTLTRFLEQGPTEAELVQAKKNITGGFPLRIDSNADIVQYLAVIGFYNLPLDYLDTFNAKVEAVTLEQVRDAFRRHLNPERQVTVVVGRSAPGAS